MNKRSILLAAAFSVLVACGLIIAIATGSGVIRLERPSSERAIRNQDVDISGLREGQVYKLWGAPDHVDTGRFSRGADGRRGDRILCYSSIGKEVVISQDGYVMWVSKMIPPPTMLPAPPPAKETNSFPPEVRRSPIAPDD